MASSLAIQNVADHSHSLQPVVVSGTFRYVEILVSEELKFLGSSGA